MDDARRRFPSQAATALVGGAIGGAAVASASIVADPVFALIEKYQRADAWANQGRTDDEVAERCDIADELLQEIVNTTPVTLAGAALMLRIAAKADAPFDSHNWLPLAAETIATLLDRGGFT